MALELRAFESLFDIPLRNGVYKPKEFHGRGIEVINMGELFAFDFIESGCSSRKVDLNLHESALASLQDGDLLFARRSLILEGSGKCSLVTRSPTPLTFESSIIRARLDNKRSNPHYYYYFFKSPQGRAAMAAISTRTAVSGITGTSLAKLIVPTPSLAVQNKVTALLGNYDDLIENNTRRIAILEEMARALYREWFIEFRFPGHPPPSKKLPSGWIPAPFSKLVHINPRTAVPKEGTKPFVPMSSLALNGMHISDVETREGNSGAKFRNGDTLFARITPCIENGKTGFVQFLPSNDDTAFGSTEFIVLRGAAISPEMVYLLARTDELRSHAIASMSGATGRQRIQEICFDSFRTALPPPGLIERFTGLVRPMFKAIHTLATMNANLRATRDLLLPRLISGELDVSRLPDPGAIA